MSLHIKHYLRLLFFFIPILAWRLSDKSPKSFFLTLKFWWFVITRKFILKNKKSLFYFEYNKCKFNLELESAIDIAVLSEVFVLKEYDWDININPKNILDLGAHWGDSSIFYAMRYPDAKVFAIEPTGKAFFRLEKLAKQFENIIPMKIAVGDSDGRQTMFISDNTLGNSIIERGINSKKEIVDCYTLQSLSKKLNITFFDLIKFDIEGAEYFIFKDENVKNFSNHFIGEIHLDLMKVTLDDVKIYFKDFSLDLFKINENRYIVKARKQT